MFFFILTDIMQYTSCQIFKDILYFQHLPQPKFQSDNFFPKKRYSMEPTPNCKIKKPKANIYTFVNRKLNLYYNALMFFTFYYVEGIKMFQ